MQRFHSFLNWWENGARSDYDALLFDIDGTLILGGGNAIPGAKEVIRRLQEENKPFRLLTNDGNRSREKKCSFLTTAGFDITPAEVIPSTLALSGAVQQNGLTGKRLFILGKGSALPSYIRDAGMVPVENLEEIESCEAIFAGGGFYDWQPAITAVFNYFARHPEKPFLVSNPDCYWPDPNGGYGIGAGSQARFVQFLLSELGIEKKPLYLGKPYPAIFEYALEDIRRTRGDKTLFRKERVLMLGDFLKSDIAGARQFGIAAGLLMTGLTTEQTLQNVSDAEHPDYVFVQWNG